MGSRLELHDEFIELLGSRNVYYQPPASVLMQYKCIRYNRSTDDVKHANNRIYTSTKCYEGVVIGYDPDDDLPDRLRQHFQMCSLGKPYVVNNLYHFPFTLYY